MSSFASTNTYLILRLVVRQKTLQKLIKDLSLYLLLMLLLSQEKMFGLFLTEDLCLLNLKPKLFGQYITSNWYSKQYSKEPVFDSQY